MIDCLLLPLTYKQRPHDDDDDDDEDEHSAASSQFNASYTSNTHTHNRRPHLTKRAVWLAPLIWRNLRNVSAN